MEKSQEILTMEQTGFNGNGKRLLVIVSIISKVR